MEGGSGGGKRGGGGARQNLRVIRRRAELSLPLLARGRHVILLYVSLIFKQDGYCTVLNSISVEPG